MVIGSDWKKAASQLIQKYGKKSHEHFLIRSYLRAVQQGNKAQASHAAKNLLSPKDYQRVRDELIDLVGTMESVSSHSEAVAKLRAALQEDRGFKPGTRRTWGAYEYEKQRSGKWKRIGKAGTPKGAESSQVDISKLLDNLSSVVAKLPQPPPARKHVEIAQKVINAHKDGLQTKLDTLKQLAPPGAQVVGRVKELESAVGKISRKPKYGTAAGLTDITGTRLVMDTIDQVNETVSKIKKKYEIVEEEDFISKANDGYRSYHIIAKDENGLDFEIQIRTKNQNTWADWAHNVYKPLNKEQEQAIKDNSGEINRYRLLMSAYFFAKDSPKASKIEAPPCPPAVKQVFGCM